MKRLVHQKGGSRSGLFIAKRSAAMTDPKDPLKDGLTPPDYDEYGDAPGSGDSAEPDEGGDPGNEPNPGESPLG
jgi:hypothetical protein